VLRSGQSNRPKRISSRDGEMHFCQRPRSTSDAKMGGGENGLDGVVKRAFRLSLEAKFRSDATGQTKPDTTFPRFSGQGALDSLAVQRIP
jgi:hypothetical protein